MWIVHWQFAVFELAGAAGHLQDFDGKIKYGAFLGISNIEWCVQFAGCGHRTERDNSFNQIRNEAEAARLKTITVYRQWFPLESLNNEVRNDPPVVRSHSRTVGIEDSNNPGIDIVITAIGHCAGFSETFG